MNLILVSGRYEDPQEVTSRDAAFVTAIASEGHEVTWIRPDREGAAPRPTVPPEVRVEEVATVVPPFRSVQERLLDPKLERRIMEIVRADLPDLVHLLDYGGCTSVNATWAANRLGARCVVSVTSVPTICHRGDLRFAGGEQCEDWTSAARCARCCSTAATGGLNGFQSGLGRVLSALRSPINPYPTELDFMNRMDLLVGGLQYAERVFVATEQDCSMLGALGLRKELFEILPPYDGSGSDASSVQLWVDAYDRVCGVQSSESSCDV